MSVFVASSSNLVIPDHIVTDSLGVSLPFNDDHAVSVSLPLWQHVVGYEEGDQQIIDSMISGYPRFRFNNYVRYVMDLILIVNKCSPLALTLYSAVNIATDQLSCMLFPAICVADRFEQFMNYNGASVWSFSIAETSIYVSFFPSNHAATAKKYWQHCGEIVSSRVAAAALDHCLMLLDCAPFSKQSMVSWSEALAAVSEKVMMIPGVDLLQPINRDRDHHHQRKCQPEVAAVIKQRLAAIINHDKSPSPDHIPIQTDDIQLTICGMAAIYTAFRLLRTFHQTHPTTSSAVAGEIAVFGFPYLDTLKIMSREEWNQGGVHFFGRGEEEDYFKLEQLLKDGVIFGGSKGEIKMNKIMGVFTELPSNPLMKCPDLVRLTSLANQYNVALVVDDTIGNIANLNLFDGGQDGGSQVKIDMLVTSLTKIFSGVGDVMAGSLILNPNSMRYQQWKDILTQMNQAHDIPELCQEDCIVLGRNSRLFLHRSSIINRNALQLATWLQSQSKEVKSVYYPGLVGLGKEIYDNVKRPNITLQTSPDTPIVTHEAGYGCLLSFELNDCMNVEVFYDELKVNKGPSLGTDFTLVCPYTLLAHYTELDWAESFGISKHLIRVSVGMEEISSLIATFRVAFDRATLTR